MTYRFATLNDVPLLARLNRQLVADEDHRHASMPADWFEARMRGLIEDAYKAVLFDQSGEIVAYAMYADHPDHSDTIYLRQLFVDRDHRRQGVGREAMQILREEIWPLQKRLTVEVLLTNKPARRFFEAIGYRPYSVELEMTARDRQTDRA